MANRNEWEEFFNAHAPDYMQNCFTTNTVEEIKFLLEELSPPVAGSVLDIGCGTGRHSVPLAKLGYKVTGVDISQGMLKEARKTAEAAGADVEFVQMNAAEFKREAGFDSAICLCEGAFCLIGAGEDPVERDLQILRNICASLKPGGKFILTALSGLKKARQYSNADVAAGVFDPVTMSEMQVMEWEAEDGHKSVSARERGYVPTELTLMFRVAGFEVEHIYGGTAGNWGRRPIDLDEYEIMVIARKP